MAYTNQGLVGTAQGSAANQPFATAAQAYPVAARTQAAAPAVVSTATAPQPFVTAAQAYPVQPIVINQTRPPWWYYDYPYYYNYGWNDEDNEDYDYYFDHGGEGRREFGRRGNGDHGHGGHFGGGGRGGGRGGSGGHGGGGGGGGHGGSGGGGGGGGGGHGRLEQGILEMLNNGAQAVQLSAQNNNVKYRLPPNANAVTVQRTDSSNNSVAVYPPAGQTIEGQPFLNLGAGNCHRYARLVRHGRDWKLQL